MWRIRGLLLLLCVGGAAWGVRANTPTLVRPTVVAVNGSVLELQLELDATDLTTTLYWLVVHTQQGGAAPPWESLVTGGVDTAALCGAMEVDGGGGPHNLTLDGDGECRAQPWQPLLPASMRGLGFYDTFYGLDLLDDPPPTCARCPLLSLAADYTVFLLAERRSAEGLLLRSPVSAALHVRTAAALGCAPFTLPPSCC
jgi:hypothetical protein